jgi:hypothetical protein
MRFGIRICYAFCSGAAAAELFACFTPGQDCRALIVREIDSAKSELLVQGYAFTSAPIIGQSRAPRIVVPT